jgi:hypothetical protein
LHVSSHMFPGPKRQEFHHGMSSLFSQWPRRPYVDLDSFRACWHHGLQGSNREKGSKFPRKNNMTHDSNQWSSSGRVLVQPLEKETLCVYNNHFIFFIHNMLITMEKMHETFSNNQTQHIDKNKHKYNHNMHKAWHPQSQPSNMKIMRLTDIYT